MRKRRYMRTISITERYTNRTTSEKPTFLYVEGMVCGFLTYPGL